LFVKMYKVKTMRYILTSIIVVFSFVETALAQQGKCKSCIEWSENRKLTWDDFTGKPNRISHNEAMTDSGMSISLDCNEERSNVKIETFFNPKKSWTKDHKSTYLLAHEQLHFDITELFVRKLKKQLAKIGNDCKLLNQHIEAYYQNNYKEFAKYQAAYDTQTKHSIDKERQLHWQKKVAKELYELRMFSKELGLR